MDPVDDHDGPSLFATRARVPFTYDADANVMLTSEDGVTGHWTRVERRGDYEYGERHADVERLYSDDKRVLPHSDEWYEKRKGVFTASRVAAAIAWTYNPNVARYEEFVEKVTLQRVQIEAGSFQEMMMKHGQFHEEHAARVYEFVTGNVLDREPVGLVMDACHEFIAATPDFVVRNRPILIEIKCPKMRKITHEVPYYYYPQLQIQMHVCRIPHSHFVQYKPPTLTEPGFLDIIDVPYDERWCMAALTYLAAMRSLVREYQSRYELIKMGDGKSHVTGETLGDLLDRKRVMNELKIMELKSGVHANVLRPNFVPSTTDASRSLVTPTKKPYVRRPREPLRGPAVTVLPSPSQPLVSRYFGPSGVSVAPTVAAPIRVALDGDTNESKSRPSPRSTLTSQHPIVSHPLMDPRPVVDDTEETDTVGTVCNQMEVDAMSTAASSKNQDYNLEPKVTHIPYACDIVVHSDFALCSPVVLPVPQPVDTQYPPASTTTVMDE